MWVIAIAFVALLFGAPTDSAGLCSRINGYHAACDTHRASVRVRPDPLWIVIDGGVRVPPVNDQVTVDSKVSETGKR